MIQINYFASAMASIVLSVCTAICAAYGKEVEIKVPNQKDWSQKLELAKGASSVYYRGLCLFKDHISELEYRGGKEEVKQVLAYLEGQKFVDSRIEDREPQMVGIGGGVRFYNHEGVEVARIFYMVNDFGIVLSKQKKVMYVTKHHDTTTFMSDEKSLPFVFFGEILELGEWEDIRVRQKMKNIHEYRKINSYLR